tara:strand:- start:366 stop:788 length:423 start_codon:yes stop_codon:yes gene_type:complete
MYRAAEIRMFAFLCFNSFVANCFTLSGLVFAKLRLIASNPRLAIGVNAFSAVSSKNEAVLSVGKRDKTSNALNRITFINESFLVISIKIMSASSPSLLNPLYQVSNDVLQAFSKPGLYLGHQQKPLKSSIIKKKLLEKIS